MEFLEVNRIRDSHYYQISWFCFDFLLVRLRGFHSVCPFEQPDSDCLPVHPLGLPRVFLASSLPTISPYCRTCTWEPHKFFGHHCKSFSTAFSNGRIMSRYFTNRVSLLMRVVTLSIKRRITNLCLINIFMSYLGSSRAPCRTL